MTHEQTPAAMTPEEKLVTLFGGKLVTVAFDPIPDPSVESGFRKPPEQSVKVRQIPIGQFKLGFKLMEEDEVAFLAFVIDQPLEFVTGKPERKDAAGKVIDLAQPPITGASYETILAAAREVNRHGFFTYAARRSDLELSRNGKALAEMLANLPADRVALVNQQITQQSTSPISSLRPVPKPR